MTLRTAAADLVTLQSNNAPAQQVRDGINWLAGQVEGDDTLSIPTPRIAPFGIPIESASGIHDVWDVFVKPCQSDDAPPHSIEERALMAILRAVHEGLHRVAPCTKCGAA